LGHHLEGQPARLVSCYLTKPNLAQVRLRACLVDQLSSDFYETLGDEKASKYLSNDMPKVELRDQLELLLIGKKSMLIPFTRLQAS